MNDYELPPGRQTLELAQEIVGLAIRLSEVRPLVSSPAQDESPRYRLSRAGMTVSCDCESYLGEREWRVLVKDGEATVFDVAYDVMSDDCEIALFAPGNWTDRLFGAN